MLMGNASMIVSKMEKTNTSSMSEPKQILCTGMYQRQMPLVQYINNRN